MNYYIDKPNIVKQLRAADPKNPALQGYIYEAMRKEDFHQRGDVLTIFVV